jgi:hypothetical protein
MNNIERFLKRDHWIGKEENRGLNKDMFGDAMDRAGASEDPQEMDKLYVQPGYHKNGTPKDDPYGAGKKPAGVPVWDHAPATPAEEALYYGTHIHSESNPLGLHSHVPGGTQGGGHNHGPQNRFGAHHHKSAPGGMVQLDGEHEHGGVNYPDGKHDHAPENFG